MDLASAGLQRKLIAMQLLLCAALFFPVSSIHAQRVAPLDTREAQIWKQHGFGQEDGAEWKHVGFSPAEAREWVRAGIPYAQWADQWRGEGFGPAQAREWVKEVNVYTAGDFRKFGFGSREAMEWIGQGIRSGLRAKEFRDGHFTAAQAGLWWKRGIFPDEARVWRDAGFGVDEAIEWKYGKKKTHYMSGGVKGYSRPVFPVEWAIQWKAAGFSSTEAKQCRHWGMGFEEAVRWQRAGFGIQDAFEWKDSGFGPEAAKHKVTAGLTPVEAERERDALRQPEGDEITKFHSDILLHPDSTLFVTECIEVLDRPRGVMQGCFKRTLAGRATLHSSDDSSHTVAPSHRLLQVLKDGSPVQYSVERDRWGDLSVCIGDRNEATQERIHVFTIAYVTDNRLVELHGHDEIFFDVTGPYLGMPVGEASATVRLPKGADLIFADGHAGPRERKYFVAQIRETEAGDEVEYEVTRPLKEEMLFQISVGFPKGAARPGLMRKLVYLDREMGRIFSAVGVFMSGLVMVLAYFLVVWRKVGKDPMLGPAAPRYEPPAGVSPAMTRFIVTRGRFDDRLMAALLVRLAQSGAIRIAKDGDLYRISRIGAAATTCLPEETTLLDGLLARSDTLVVGVKHAGRMLRSITSPLKRVLQQGYGKYFVTNSRYLWCFFGLSLLAAAVGFFFLHFPLHEKRTLVVAVYFGFAGVVLGIMLVVFYRLLKAPTRAGAKLLGEIEGYGKFLAVNYGRARVLGERPQPEAPPFLEKHLPYAIALGIDSEYVSIRTKALDWYSGRGGGFSAHDFTSSLKVRKSHPARAVRSTPRRGQGAE